MFRAVFDNIFNIIYTKLLTNNNSRHIKKNYINIQ